MLLDLRPFRRTLRFGLIADCFQQIGQSAKAAAHVATAAARCKYDVTVYQGITLLRNLF